MKNFVYLHKNLINGKIYIGQSLNPVNRWAGSGAKYKGCVHFWRAIKKYGWENFSHKILKENLSNDEADYWEDYYIRKMDTTNPQKGYNILKGGKTRVDDKNMLKKLSLAQKERWTEERRREHSEKIKKYYERLSEEDKKKKNDKIRGEKSSRAKRVVCRETGKVFPTMTAAGEWAGTTQPSIRSQIKGDYYSAGEHPETGERLHWYYEGEENSAAPVVRSRKDNPIKNIETGTIFRKPILAAEWCGLASSSHIVQAAKSKGRKSAGKHPVTKIPLHWIYLYDD